MAQAPDVAIARDNSTPFPLHPKVTMKPARFVDVINLGLSVIKFPGSDDYLAEQVVLVLWTGEKDTHGSGKVVTVEQRYTMSLGAKAKLRALIEGWRGDVFTDEEIKKFKKDGFDVSKMYGKPCLLSTVHKTSQAGRVRCEILQCAAVPDEMKGLIPKMDSIPYTRNPWWETEKKRIAEETQAWIRANRPNNDEGDGDPGPTPPFDDDDSSVPF